MSEFDKWYKVEIFKLEWDYEIVAQASWKAALKWALKQLEKQYESAAQGDTGWQGKFIEQEIEANE